MFNLSFVFYLQRKIHEKLLEQVPMLKEVTVRTFPHPPQFALIELIA